jgi:hypothetical protein
MTVTLLEECEENFTRKAKPKRTWSYKSLNKRKREGECLHYIKNYCMMKKNFIGYFEITKYQCETFKLLSVNGDAF